MINGYTTSANLHLRLGVSYPITYSTPYTAPYNIINCSGSGWTNAISPCEKCKEHNGQIYCEKKVCQYCSAMNKHEVKFCVVCETEIETI